MFRRLHAVGGFWYVLGGISILVMCLSPVLFTLSYFGMPIPEIVLDYSFVALLIGGAICTVVFNSGNMQVVAQNRTTEMLERISMQLEERDLADSRRQRPVRRQVIYKQIKEEAEVPCEKKQMTVVVSAQEKTAHQEGYRCPVTNAVIAVRD